MVDGLDRAISSAMGDELPPAPAPETDSEGTEEDVVVEQETEEEPSSKARDEKGRFLPSSVKEEKPPKEAPQQPQESPEAEKAAEKPADYAAGRLTSEEKAILAQLPPEAGALVKRILAKQDAHHTRRMMEVANAKKDFAAIEEVMAPNRDRWRAHGVSNAQAVKNLLTVEAMMIRDAPGTIQWLADQYGVKLQQPASQPTDGQDASVNVAPTPSAPPVDLETRQRIQSLEEQLKGFTAQTQQQRLTEMQAVTTRVLAEHPLKEFIPLIEGRLPHEIQLLRNENPSLQPEELLKQAIDVALRANPQTYQLLVDQKLKEERERQAGTSKQRVEKARRASASVRGAPVSGMERMSKDLDDIISEALEGA